MKNILVPVGSHSNALNTLQYAIDFAEYMDAKIYLVHIFSSTKISGSFVNIDPILEQESKNIIKEHLSNVDKKNVEIDAKILKGHTISSGIEKLTELLEIDLIISSTKNDPSDNTIFLGKIIGSLVKDTNMPILLIPTKAQFKPVSKILMTIKSGKIEKESTLEALTTIKNRFNSTVNLLQVKTPSLKPQDLVVNESLSNLISELILTNNATVFQGVLEFLHEEDPDMICVIRRKRGFFKKLWENDKVRKVDFESNVPLLVLKGLS